MDHTEDQMKLALVRALPEKLGKLSSYAGAEITDSWFAWKESGKEVTPHEWPAIVGMVEEKLFFWPRASRLMDAEDYQDYLMRLVELAPVGQSSCASWQVRAQALADIGAITIL